MDRIRPSALEEYPLFSGVTAGYVPKVGLNLPSEKYFTAYQTIFLSIPIEQNFLDGKPV